MKLKQTIALLLLFPLTAILFFIILCTVVAFSKAETLPSLVVFVPLGILLFFLLRLCIRTLKSSTGAAESEINRERKPVTIICPECGGRNHVSGRKTVKCRYCFSNLNRSNKDMYL